MNHTRICFSKQAASSKAWMSRQFRDPYVKARLSSPNAYRSRSAFKLLQLDERWGKFLTRPDVHSVVDLGAAPGGWTQVVAAKMGWVEDADSYLKEEPLGERKDRPSRFKKSKSWSGELEETALDTSPDGLDPLHDISSPPRVGRGTIISVDLLPIMPIPGVHTLKADFLAPETTKMIRTLLRSPQNPSGRADVVLSDMAANFTGNRVHDTESSLEICEAVFAFCVGNLRTVEEVGRSRAGVLLLKHFAHPLLEGFRKEKLEPNFQDVKYVKPDSSRSESSEGYWVCQGWKGGERSTRSGRPPPPQLPLS